VNLDPVTVRWADALFNLAKRSGALDEVRRDMQRLAQELSPSSVQAYLFGGSASQLDKRAKLESLLGFFHPMTQNFVRLSLDRRREEVLRTIAVAFERRLLRDQGAVEGHVESARALDESQLNEIAAAMGKKLGKTVRLESRINPDLVAGVRIFVGARMLDYSVQGRLDGLRRKMMEATLPVA
jgi:F-type H+-transporting ATPase subunit delta